MLIRQHIFHVIKAQPVTPKLSNLFWGYLILTAYNTEPDRGLEAISILLCSCSVALGK